MIPISKKMLYAISGRDTTIYPLVVINGLTSPYFDHTENLHISTHSVTLAEYPSGVDHIFHPILLNVPNITQRVQIESRKFSINSLKIQLSNLPVFAQNKRLTDFGNMNNKKIDVYYSSQSIKTFGETGNALLVFSGYVKGFTYDGSKVSIDIEDGANDLYETKIPLMSDKIGDDAIRDEDRDKPYPYVFGDLEKAPAYLVKTSSMGVDSDINRAIIAERGDYLRTQYDEDILVHLGNTTVGNNFFSKEMVNQGGLNIGVTHINIFENGAYLSLHYWNPHITFPRDDDGRKIDYNSWNVSTDDVWQWTKDWNGDTVYDDDIGGYIQSFSNRGRGWYIEPDESGSGNLVQRNMIPLTIINKPISVDTFLNRDADTELFDNSAVVAHMDVYANSGSGETPDPTSKQMLDMLTNQNFETYIKISGYHQIGTNATNIEHTNHSSWEMGNRPVEAGFTFTFKDMPNFPCKTYVMMRLTEEYLLYDHGPNYGTQYSRPPLMIWVNEIESNSHQASGGDDMGGYTFDDVSGKMGPYFDNIRESLEQRSKVFSTIDLGHTAGETATLQYHYPTATTGECAAVRIHSKDTLENLTHSGAQDFDNCHTGTHYATQGTDGEGRGIRLHETVKQVISQGVGGSWNLQAYGGMGFNTLGAFSRLNLGLPYNIYPFYNADENRNVMQEYLYEAASFDFGAYDNFVIQKQTIGNHGGQGDPSPYDIKLYNFSLMHHAVTQNWDDKSYFIKARSNRATNNYYSIIEHIMNTVLSGGFTIEEYFENPAVIQNLNYDYDFSLIEHMELRDFITTLSKQSQSVVKHNFKNELSFFTLAKTYDPASENMANISIRILNENDVMKYKFKRSKGIYTKCIVKYGYDYGNEEFIKQTEELEISDPVVAQGYSSYDYSYYGTQEDKTLEIEAPYIQNDSSALELARFYLHYHCNPHNQVSMSIPLNKGLDLETGDIVALDYELDNMRLFGIRYGYNDFEGDTDSYKQNEQYVYPLWIITKIVKSLDKVDIEAEQLHHLSNENVVWQNRTYAEGSGWSSEAIYGCPIDSALNYDPNANTNDGSCVYPDQDDSAPIVDLFFKETQGGFESDEISQGSEIDILMDNHGITIKNFSYDPDDLEGTGYSDVDDIPNFSATQTAQLTFKVGLVVLHGNSVIAHNTEIQTLEQGYTWEDDMWTANLPDIYFNLDANDIVLNEDDYPEPAWVAPISTEEYYTYYIYADTYQYGQNLPANNQTFNFDFNAKRFSEVVSNGDVNQDGIFNILDIVMMAQGVLGNVTLTEEQQIIADVNNDGVLNVMDVVIGINLILSN